MKNAYLAIITARAGSKRLPNKNVLELNGKPLFVWSILASLGCSRIGRTVVSTDSIEYRRIAIKAGAECSKLRSMSLSSDTTSSADVVMDVLENIGTDIGLYKGLILLQPTSPLRSSKDIYGAISLFETQNAPAVVSISQAECSPHWVGRLSRDLIMDDFIPKQYREIQSQDLGEWYRLNGAIYIIGIDQFRKERGFIPQGTLGYVMPRERSIDVDTAFDFKVASLLMTSDITLGQ